MASRSPPAATPLPKSSVAPETPKDATALQPKPFPSPTTFEIIPPLHGILSRLLIQKPPSTQPGDAPGETNGALGPLGDAATQGQQAPTSMPGRENNETGASQTAADIPILNPKASEHLDTKDLPTATSSVKIRIQKARGVVEELPDVHRSVEEQENEIEELEDRVARLRSVISDFGNRAAKTQAERAEAAA